MQAGATINSIFSYREACNHPITMERIIFSSINLSAIISVQVDTLQWVRALSILWFR